MTIQENIPFAKAELYGSGVATVKDGITAPVNNLEGTHTVYNYTPTLETVASNHVSKNSVIPVATAVSTPTTPTTPCIPNNNNIDWLNAPATQRDLKKMKKKRKKNCRCWCCWWGCRHGNWRSHIRCCCWLYFGVSS